MQQLYLLQYLLGKEFYKTYQGLIDLLTQLELFGVVTPDGLPKKSKDAVHGPRTGHYGQLPVRDLQCKQYWSHRLLESRQIVSEQLKGISEVIGSLPAELEFEVVTGDLEPGLRKKLKEEGVPVDNLLIYRLNGKGIEVSITKQLCGGGMCCKDIIMPVLAKALEQPLYAAASICTARVGDVSCHLRFYPELNYRLTLGWPVSAKRALFPGIALLYSSQGALCLA